MEILSAGESDFQERTVERAWGQEASAMARKGREEARGAGDASARREQALESYKLEAQEQFSAEKGVLEAQVARQNLSSRSCGPR